MLLCLKFQSDSLFTKEQHQLQFTTCKDDKIAVKYFSSELNDRNMVYNT